MIRIVQRETEHPAELVWVQVSRDYDRSACGRFDLLYSESLDRWCAVDADAGKVFRAFSRFEAESWCARAFSASGAA